MPFQLRMGKELDTNSFLHNRKDVFQVDKIVRWNTRMTFQKKKNIIAKTQMFKICLAGNKKQFKDFKQRSNKSDL